MAQARNTKTKKLRQEIEEQAATGDPNDPKTKMARALSEESTVFRRIEYGGETYTIEADAADNIELIEMLEDEKYVSAVRLIIGPSAWKTFKDSHRTADGRVPLGELEGFLNAVMGVADPQGASES